MYLPSLLWPYSYSNSLLHLLVLLHSGSTETYPSTLLRFRRHLLQISISSPCFKNHSSAQSIIPTYETYLFHACSFMIINLQQPILLSTQQNINEVRKVMGIGGKTFKENWLDFYLALQFLPVLSIHHSRIQRNSINMRPRHRC